jgi:hypothetical protein
VGVDIQGDGLVGEPLGELVEFRGGVEMMTMDSVKIVNL